MTTPKNRRLGRGLMNLLGGLDDHGGDRETPRPDSVPSTQAAPRSDSPEAPREEAPAGFEAMVRIDLERIDINPFQPRRNFSETEIAALAESLREHDMLQPLIVRASGDRFQLISGERRLRAAKVAGWTQVPCRVRDADDRLVAELAIVENLQRQDLNAIEKALSFKRYLEEHHCTQDHLADRLKLNRSTIANLIRLLELPEEVQRAIADGSLSAGHARALLPLGEERVQVAFCRKILGDQLSVRETERIVKEKIADEDEDRLTVYGDERDATPAPDPAAASQNGDAEIEEPPQPPPTRAGRAKAERDAEAEHLLDLAQQLRMALGTKVELSANRQGKGRITIQFNNHEEFERLFDALTQPSGYRNAS